MLKKKVEEALIKQIAIEEDSSRIYLAMASWCESQGYPGAAQFLYAHAEEERMHQLKLIKYVNERNGYAKLMALKEPKVEFKTLHAMFEAVMKHEIFVTNSINNIVEICMAEKDYNTANFIQWYVMEQVEEEALFQGILDQFKLAGDVKGSLFMIDKELAGMAAAANAGV